MSHSFILYVFPDKFLYYLFSFVLFVVFVCFFVLYEINKNKNNIKVTINKIFNCKSLNLMTKKSNIN